MGNDEGNDIANQASVVREIGSDFERVEDRFLRPTASTRLPWDDPAGSIAGNIAGNTADNTAGNITYVESGRQALGLVEAQLRGQGHTQLHVPSYLCDTMISPFQRTGWTLRPLPVDSDLVVSPSEVLAQVTSGVYLHAPYFGRQDSAATLAALETLRTRKVVVVVDETHRFLSGPSPVADIRVASLRKVLPVYDGAYVTGLSGSPGGLAEAAVHSGIADLRQSAQITKSGVVASGDSNKAHLAMFASAEQMTETRRQPAPISSKSFSLLHHLDLGLLSIKRQANSTALTEALRESGPFRIINPPATNLLPSHLVLETDDATGLRQFLVQKHIYCAIHWPESRLLPRTQPWPRRYISLPVDHRYGKPDMARIAAGVKAFFTGQDFRR